MTENVTTVTGVGATLPSNTTIGADNISSVYYERVKIAQGDTGTAVDVSSGAPLWVNVATTGNILGTFTTSTGTIGAVLQGTSPWVTSINSSTATIGNVLGSFSISSSTLVIGAVFPSTQWTVTTTPSSQATVSVQPTTQWTISVTPTTQFSVTTTPSSVQTVATSSTTTVQGTVVTIPSSQAIVSVTPTTQFTVTTTPSSVVNVTTTPSSQATVSVQPTTQWTVSVTPTSAISVMPSSVYQVAASAETATIFNGTASLTPTFATITATSSGIVQQVAGVSGKAIRIISAYLTVDGPTYISWTSSTTALNYSGLTYLTTGDGIVLPFNPVGWLQTTTTGALSINSSAPVTIGGAITYVSL